MFTSFNPLSQNPKKESKLSVDNRLPPEINKFLDNPNAYKERVEEVVNAQREIAFNQIDQIRVQMEQFLDQEKQKVQSRFNYFEKECLRNFEIFNDMCKKFTSSSSENDPSQ